MSTKLEVSADLEMISELNERLAKLPASEGVSLSTRARTRDSSVIELVISAVVGGVAKMVFEFLTQAIKDAWAKKKSRGALLIRLDGQVIEIKTEEDFKRLKEALNVR